MATSEFNRILSKLLTRKSCKRVGVICPSDEATQYAVARAASEGIAEPVVFDDEDTQTAAARAVEAARCGKVDLLMKGLVGTDVLMRAILDKEHGILQKGHVLTHMSVAEIPGYHKLLFFTDAAVIPLPTTEQRIEQTRYIADFCRRCGVDTPKISLIHCIEKANAKNFPYTMSYQTIKDMAAKGEFGPCIIDGPLDLKTSLSLESMEKKHIESPIRGDADALIFPEIESANVFYKTITLFCKARTTGTLMGTQVPVVVSSRADAAEVKYLSLCIASLL